jgi:dephospho-CoA kinase
MQYSGNSTPFKLGVTGGIGSGKTSVCKVFNILGIPVFSADLIAKEIIDNDISIRSGINTVTGRDLYGTGTINRAEFADLIFNNPDMLKQVNALVHPVVFSRFGGWAESQSAPYVIMEAAILIESGAVKFVDRILTVTAPVEERISRVIRRNYLSSEQVMDRIRNQMDDDERIKLSHYIIKNSEKDMIIPSIIEIHHDILKVVNEMKND